MNERVELVEPTSFWWATCSNRSFGLLNDESPDKQIIIIIIIMIIWDFDKRVPKIQKLGNQIPNIHYKVIKQEPSTKTLIPLK